MESAALAFLARAGLALPLRFGRAGARSFLPLRILYIPVRTRRTTQNAPCETLLHLVAR